MGFPAGSYAGSDSAQNADGVDSHEHWMSGAVSHTATLSASLTNEFRAGVSVNDLRSYAADRGFDASAALGIPGLGSSGMPNFSVLGFASLGTGSAAPFAMREASYELEDSVAWKTGRHSWRFGFQAIRAARLGMGGLRARLLPADARADGGCGRALLVVSSRHRSG